MFALQKSHDHQGHCIPNVLPCRVNHDGPVNATQRYWAPFTSEDGKMTTYFRGRKLHGKSVKVPEGYRGVVVAGTEKVLEQDKEAGPRDLKTEDGDGDVDDEMQDEEVMIMEEKAKFEELVVWGHEVLPDEGVDPYLIGMREWIGMTEKIHEYSVGGNEENGSNKA